MASGKMALLTRDQILKARDIKTELVEVPEWGGSVYVRGLTGRQRDEFEASMVDTKNRDRQGRPGMNLSDARARFVSLCVVDDAGRLLFEQSDIMALSAKSAAALERVWKVARVLSGMSDDDLAELVGNSSGALNGASTDGSLVTSDMPA